MGYRLDIGIIEKQEYKNLYYGTKLYGYQLDLTESLSYEFLRTIHKFNGEEYGEEYFDYGFDNEIILNYEELCLFLKLYNIDYNKFPLSKEQEKDLFINSPEINELLINVEKYEYSNFIVSWS